MNKAEIIINNMENIIIGKRKFLERVVIALITEGHILIEDVPGIGKTQCACSLAKSVNGSFNRVQFTPDVMASDITGFSLVNQSTGDLSYKEGAVNCNFLLADEINRASSKTQSSLLEAMEEGQVSVDGITHNIPKPFMVIATQNPVENKGTNKLPEAQMDRFLFKLSIGYPNPESEIAILDRFFGDNPLKKLPSVIGLNDLVKIQDEVNNIKVHREIKAYIINITNATRNSDLISLGASPRASLALLRASKGYAYMQNRDYVLPEDVKEICFDVLCHRIILSSAGKVQGLSSRDVLEKVLNTVRVNITWKE
ncbi:MAG: AAA family ATPase [Clostridium sp.]